MSRYRTEARLERILEAALGTFLELGYRGTKLQEVADRAGVSVGSLYSYLENKEALFELVLRTALHEPIPDVDALPFRSAHGADHISWVWERLQEIARFPRLEEAVACDEPEDALQEFEEVLREIWAWQSRYWRAIELIERCAKEWPDLHMLYYKQFRRGVFGRAASLIERRMSQGVIRRYPDSATALRVIVENIAFFAMHRHVRADSADLDEDVSRETVIRMLIAGFSPERSQGEDQR